ncbi:7112_t:CDS:2 [Rhizophagus irregularis]|nr:7112_t:CDS:2 [Rhizophagus irregularis]
MESDSGDSAAQDSLPERLKPFLPQCNTYLIEKFSELPSYRTAENFNVTQFELKAYVNVDNKEEAHKELYHCIHSNEVKRKQGNRETKRPQSARARNVNCAASLHLRIERKRLPYSHSDGHSPSSALYAHEDSLHLNASDEQELMEILADRAKNPDYDYVAKIFQQYRESALGSRNSKPMFERLKQIVEDYDDSGQGRAVLQEYNASSGSVFILCIVTNLMSRVHEKIRQSEEICYMDASAAFDPLNTSITLLYSSCAVGALPLGVLFTSDELEITLEKVTILPSHAFYGRGAEVGPIVFLTDDSSAERNSLELCWPQGIRLLCTFHVLQAFWRWLHDSKHHIKKEDRAPIMEKMKKILYSTSGPEMDVHYNEFKQKFYGYNLLRKHFELLWNRRQFWARTRLPMRENNTNNYIERSFGMLKDIIFARTQAFNPVQIFHFITMSMERFYARRLLGIAHKHPGHLRIARRFLCPGWEKVDANLIQKTNIDFEFIAPSASNSGIFYIVNTKIGACTCPVGISGGPCKHQGAVAMKFHISTLNFIPSLTPNDRMVYGQLAENSSFYASLRAGPGFSPQDQETILSDYSDNFFNDETTEWRFVLFLEFVKMVQFRSLMR